MTATLIFFAAFSVFASTSAAQSSDQAPPGQDQQQPANPPAPGQRPAGPGMMSPDMMRMMGTMMGSMSGRPEDGAGRGRGPGGILQRVSRLLGALDDPRVRTALGLSDQQADGLRKIVVDTETFTIKTGADIAVNSIELRELLRADKPDRSAVMSKGDQISKSTSLLINHYLDAMLAAKAILTPEQQKMIRAYLESGAPILPGPPPRRSAAGQVP
ncbi:MAG TPA: periplasmic heavy metal sensor [Candidatus Acidoferrales bacterium]|nr:periplasmic heavy metal sensor [Candidatus Acidoferrales bacterium]